VTAVWPQRQRQGAQAALLQNEIDASARSCSTSAGWSWARRGDGPPARSRRIAGAPPGAAQPASPSRDATAPPAASPSPRPPHALSAAFPDAAAARAWLFQATDYERLPPPNRPARLWPRDHERPAPAPRAAAAELRRLHVAAARQGLGLGHPRACSRPGAGGWASTLRPTWPIWPSASPWTASRFRAELAGVLSEVRDACFGLPGRPTFFEIVTAAAFLHFARRRWSGRRSRWPGRPA